MFVSLLAGFFGIDSFLYGLFGLGLGFHFLRVCLLGPGLGFHFFRVAFGLVSALFL